MEPFVDRFGRTHDYLRISVTDRCNLRCLYCMPEEGMEFMESDRLLSYEQIAEVVEAGASLGIRKLRITGGEPLVRKDLEDLISRLSEIPGIEDIAMTTNGILLDQKAEALKKAGLNRVNISLDTLDPARFRYVSRSGDLRRVLSGIEAASAAGLMPLKLNVVLLKGINEDEIAEFLRWTIRDSVHIRFIEYMPIGHADEQWKEHYLPLGRVHEIAEESGFAVAPGGPVAGNGPSENFRIEGAKGSFGLIHPVSSHFCEQCNRLRLTADGFIKPCLYWMEELNVKPCLGSREGLIALFRKALEVKPKNHEMGALLANEAQTHTPTDRRMSQIGG